MKSELYIHQIKQTRMKLLQRNNMFDLRFSQSFGDFVGSKNRLLSTARNSLAGKTDNKLPQLNRSLSYSNAKNAKQKVGSLDDRLQELAKNIRELKLQTRESRRFTNFLVEDLGERQLLEHKNNLNKKLKTLEKYSKLTKHLNQQKTSFLKSQCQNLQTSTRQLKQILNTIQQRVDNIQNSMGIYSGKEKHRI